MSDQSSEHDGAISDDLPVANGNSSLDKDRHMALSLADINRNMSQMASLLATLCQQTDTRSLHDERPPGKKRRSPILGEPDSHDGEKTQGTKRPGHELSDDEVRPLC